MVNDGYTIMPMKPTNIMIPEEMRAEIEAAIEARGGTVASLTRDAIAEKLAAMGTEDTGLLAGLSPGDRQRVQRYANLLRAAPEDTPIRRALDNNFDLFEWGMHK